MKINTKIFQVTLENDKTRQLLIFASLEKSNMKQAVICIHFERFTYALDCPVLLSRISSMKNDEKIIRREQYIFGKKQSCAQVAEHLFICRS